MNWQPAKVVAALLLAMSLPSCTSNDGPQPPRPSSPEATFALARNVRIVVSGGMVDQTERDAQAKRLAEAVWAIYCARDAELPCNETEDYLIDISLWAAHWDYCLITVDGVKTSRRPNSVGTPILDTQQFRCNGGSGEPFRTKVVESPNMRRGDIGLVD
jgi:hypothetical protein